jgi:hypothetical protein
MKKLIALGTIGCALLGLQAQAEDQPLVLPPELGVLTQTIQRTTHEPIIQERVRPMESTGHEIRGVPGNYKLRLKIAGAFNDLYLSSGVLDQLGCLRHALERNMVKRFQIEKQHISSSFGRMGYADASKVVVQFKDGIKLRASDVNRLCYIANQGDHRTQVVVLDGPEGSDTGH